MAKLAADLDGSLMDRLASKGRFGDTMVAHINPQEAQMLMKEGGAGTINPMTGLPEFYDMGEFGGDDYGSYDADFSSGYSDDGIGYDDSTGIGEEGPSVADFGGVDIAGPTDEQAQEAADQMETFDTGIEVARNRGIDVNQDFMQRLSNSIEGRTQNQKGENIGLTQDEIANLSFYTNNPNDPRFGSYLGYNDLVNINAPQSKAEDNFRKDVAYTDRLNEEFKEKGLDARIAPDLKNPGNYVYTGDDATQAFLGELGSGIYNAVGGFGSMMLDATQMTPAGLVTGALFGRDLLAPQFFEGKSIPGPGKAAGKALGLVDEEGKAPFEGFLDSITGSIKSALGFGTKDAADKISVNKSGEITEASREGKDINVSGVPGPKETMENILDMEGGVAQGISEADAIKSITDMSVSSPRGSELAAEADRSNFLSGIDLNTATADVDDYLSTLDLNTATADIDDYLSTLDLNTASTLVDPAIQSTAFVDQSDPFEYGGNEPIVRRKPKPVVSQAIDDIVEEDKPYFPRVPLPRLTEGGLKTLQYIYRNDPETLQNIYNKYALPEQYSGLKALV